MERWILSMVVKYVAYVAPGAGFSFGVLMAITSTSAGEPMSDAARLSGTITATFQMESGMAILPRLLIVPKPSTPASRRLGVKMPPDTM